MLRYIYRSTSSHSKETVYIVDKQKIRHYYIDVEKTNDRRRNSTDHHQRLDYRLIFPRLAALAELNIAHSGLTHCGVHDKAP